MDGTSEGADAGAEGSGGEAGGGLDDAVSRLERLIEAGGGSADLEAAIEVVERFMGPEIGGPQVGVPAAAVDRGREALGRAVLAERAQEVRRLEERSPLRAQILALLAESPGSTPGALATSLSTNTETVSRVLRELKVGDLVVDRRDPDDRRRRPHWLTGHGLAALKQHLAHGEPPPVRRFTSDDDRALRLEALEAATTDRRAANDLATSAETLERVVLRSREAGDAALEVRALRELVTTLRQATRWPAARTHLDELRRIGAGARPDVPGPVHLSAIAHQHYESGRLVPFEGVPLPTACVHLLAAAQDYLHLEQTGSTDEPWAMRRGWAVVSVADNLRQQTLFGRGVEYAQQASDIFTACGDVYGMARSLFLAGFCSRLRGDFEGSLALLDQAAGLNTEHGYWRFTADTLMQRGEVLRSLGRDEEAIDCLREAQRLSDDMGLGQTASFARSAEGAVHFARGELDDAESCITTSLEWFAARAGRVDYDSGRALNLRRLAEVELARERRSSRKDRPDVEALLKQSAAIYQRLDSPAGRAACAVAQVRRVRAGRHSRHDVETACRVVGDIIRDDRTENNLLRRDPWVPTLVGSLVADVQYSGLERLAEPLLEDSLSPQGGDPAVDAVDRAKMAAEPRRNVRSPVKTG